MDLLYAFIFYMVSIAIVLTTAMAITRQNQVHAVIWLVGSFWGTAVLFHMLGAPLLAVLEVFVYAGAIMVLFLFIVMTVRTEVPKAQVVTFRRWAPPVVLAGISILISVVLIYSGPTGMGRMSNATASPAEFGRFIFESYWYPVELVSFLLFVGLVGALHLGRGDSPSQQQADGDGGAS